jgi:hypothetical protein
MWVHGGEGEEPGRRYVGGGGYMGEEGGVEGISSYTSSLSDDCIIIRGPLASTPWGFSCTYRKSQCILNCNLLGSRAAACTSSQ